MFEFVVTKINPRRNVVMCFIPLLLKQLYLLLGEGLINCGKPFLKVLLLFELGMDISRLFHSIIAEGGKTFWKSYGQSENRAYYWGILLCASWFVEVVSCRDNARIGFYISCRKWILSTWIHSNVPKSSTRKKTRKHYSKKTKLALVPGKY